MAFDLFKTMTSCFVVEVSFQNLIWKQQCPYEFDRKFAFSALVEWLDIFLRTPTVCVAHAREPGASVPYSEWRGGGVLLTGVDSGVLTSPPFPSSLEFSAKAEAVTWVNTCIFNNQSSIITFLGYSIELSNSNFLSEDRLLSHVVYIQSLTSPKLTT